MTVLFKRDMRLLQEKIEKLEMENTQLKQNSANFEKRSSKYIEKIANISNSSPSAYVGSPKKQGSTSFKDYFGSSGGDEDGSKKISFQVSKTTSPIKPGLEEITSEEDLSQRDNFLKDNNIAILEGKLDESESEISIKSPRSPK